MEEKRKDEKTTVPQTVSDTDTAPSGLVVTEGKYARNASPAPERPRDVTDIFLGRISLFVSSDAEVKRGFQFSFLQSRPALYLGSDREKCGKHAIVLENVAPCHASIRWQEGHLALQDEGAPDGTLLEGKKLVAYTSVPLSPQGSFRLGQVVIEYRVEQPGFSLPAAKVETQPEFVAGPASEHGVVVAEFCLTSLDAPYALPRHCEIMSKKPVFILGRDASCDYQVEFKERYVEKEQAAIVYSSQEGVFLVKEMAKDNPTYVNDQRVKEVHRLSSGDVMRLGSASNAPKVRFTLSGQESASKEVIYLSKALPALQRGETYLIGSGKSCHIQTADPSVASVAAQLKVPLQGDLLLASKAENCRNRVAIDESEVKENETRTLATHQSLQIDNCFALFHDHGNLVTPRVPEKCVLSQFIPEPQREGIYLIGNAVQCAIRIPDLGVPDLIGEISVPIEGEYFLVKKYSDIAIDLTIDGEAVPGGAIQESRYGVNQVLAIGDYLAVRNNHRSLPTYATTGVWKTFFKVVAVILLLACLGTVVGIMAKNHWHKWKDYISWGPRPDSGKKADKDPSDTQKLEQELMQKYQQNVFYILLFSTSEKDKKMASGTGFLMVQKDAREQNCYYLITCKHVIEPWKFEKHREDAGKIYDEAGKPVDTGCHIAVWPYGQNVLEERDDGQWEYLLKNSFNNATEKCLGEVSVVRTGDESDYETMENSLRRHRPNSNQDIAILEIKPQTTSIEESMLKNSYQPWMFSEKSKLEVGLPVIVLGYSSGAERLTKRGGVAKPANCKGSLASTCQAPEPLEIDANQTQGASGGPIVNYKGEILGMVSFTDSEKKMLYGIHSLILHQLLRNK